MTEILKINDLTFHDINTTVLCPSNYNLTKDTIDFLHNNCTVINAKSHYDISNIPDDIYNDFNCNDLKNKSFLTQIDNIKLGILSNLTNTEKIFVFMDVLTYLDSKFTEQIIKYLQDHSKIIINYTTDIEETLFFDYLIVIHEDKVLMEGAKEQVLAEEKILKKLGYKLPFILELSSDLKCYGLIDKTYFNLEGLVNDLWK